jgi:hypothetical protein
MTAANRQCIEVDTRASTDEKTGDPIKLFAQMVREQHHGTKDVEESNTALLQSLMQKGLIPKSSIVWHGDKISKIYGFKVGIDGKIEYNYPSRGSPKRAAKAHVVYSSPPPIDVVTLKNAILASKQMAI